MKAAQNTNKLINKLITFILCVIIVVYMKSTVCLLVDAASLHILLVHSHIHIHLFTYNCKEMYRPLNNKSFSID